MVRVPKSYRSIEEFQREEIRPGMRIGFSLEDLVEETAFEGDFGASFRDELLLDDYDDVDD